MDSNQNQKTLTLPESTCKEVASGYIDRILAAQEKAGEAKDWGVQNHHTLVFLILVELGLPEDTQKDFEAYAKACPGLFSNASQLRQSSLLKDKIAPGKKARIANLVRSLE